jgi:hypothetical protein
MSVYIIRKRWAAAREWATCVPIADPLSCRPPEFELYNTHIERQKPLIHEITHRKLER